MREWFYIKFIYLDKNKQSMTTKDLQNKIIQNENNNYYSILDKIKNDIKSNN